MKAAPALYAGRPSLETEVKAADSVLLVTVVRVSRSVLQQQLTQGEGFAV